MRVFSNATMQIYRMGTGAMNFAQWNLGGVVLEGLLQDLTLVLKFVGMGMIWENMDVMTVIYTMRMVVTNIVL